MANHSRAGQPAQQRDLINVAQLTAQYYVLKPVVGNAEHAVKFGTSGHRGSAARHSFNEPHILAIAQAIAEERAKNGVPGPCYVGKDTHALSEPAFISVLEVLAANGVDVIVQENNGFTPTPAVSNAILVHNKKGGAQVKRHHRIEIVLVHLKKRLVAGQPGTVHQNVGRGQCRQHTLNLLSVGNIQLQRVKCEPVFRCHTCGMRQRLAAPGGDPYLCARLCEGDGGSEANPS